MFLMPAETRLRFMDLAPDVELLTANGQAIRLSSLWSQHMLLLAFSRHFGCPQCKEMLAELVSFQGELKQAGISIAVVMQDAAGPTQCFCAEFAPGLLWLADAERKAYRSYGLGRGTMLQTIFSVKVWRANQRVRTRKGWRPMMPPPGQDALLMSGMFIIGKDGRVRLPYYYDDIADHPPLELLLHGFMGMDWGSPFEGPIIGKEDSFHLS
jgi:peroxiredoxin